MAYSQNEADLLKENNDLRAQNAELVEALERIANPRNFGEQSEAKPIARAALARVKGEHS